MGGLGPPKRGSTAAADHDDPWGKVHTHAPLPQTYLFVPIRPPCVYGEGKQICWYKLLGARSNVRQAGGNENDEACARVKRRRKRPPL